MNRLMSYKQVMPVELSIAGGAFMPSFCFMIVLMTPQRAPAGKTFTARSAVEHEWFSYRNEGRSRRPTVEP